MLNILKDTAGNTIRTLNLGKQDAGTTPFSWDGFADDGSVVKTGSYKFDVTATIGNSTAEATGLSYAQVLSISNNTNGIKLNLSNLTSVSTSDVKEIF
jgi:flagellar basal-body rod modification protein FlgD